MSAHTARPLVADLLRPRSGSAAIAQAVVLAFIGAAVLALSAKLKVPFFPVPMTLQTLVVLVIGATYGWRLAGATILLYLAQGAMGLPVFTNTPPQAAGPLYFLGPTGGFLAGFFVTAVMVGWAVERGAARNIFLLTGWMTAAIAVMFVLGLAWLGQAVPSVGYSWKLLEIGLTPFVLGSAVKIALAAAIVYGLRQVVVRR